MSIYSGKSQDLLFIIKFLTKSQKKGRAASKFKRIMWRETKELVANRNFVKLGRTFVSGSGHIKSFSSVKLLPLIKH